MQADREDAVVHDSHGTQCPKMPEGGVEQGVGSRPDRQGQPRRRVCGRGWIDEGRPVAVEHRTEQVLDHALGRLGSRHEALM